MREEAAIHTAPDTAAEAGTLSAGVSSACRWWVERCPKVTPRFLLSPHPTLTARPVL